MEENQRQKKEKRNKGKRKYILLKRTAENLQEVFSDFHVCLKLVDQRQQD